MLPKAIDSQWRSPSNTSDVFEELKTLKFLTFLLKYKEPQITKATEQKHKSGNITKLNFKTHYWAMLTNTAWYWHKAKHGDQQSKPEDPDIEGHIFNQVIFTKTVKTLFASVSFFNKWCWGVCVCRRLEFDGNSYPLSKRIT